MLLAGLPSCKRAPKTPPLAPELQAIKCPADKPANASATFVNARITFVCISKALASSPHLLRCDLDSRPMICEDEGSMYFTRSTAGDIYGGPAPKGVEIASTLLVNFRKGPPRTSTFEEAETDWRFLLPGGTRLLSPPFNFAKGTLCDRASTVLGNGVCNLEAQSDSLYWHIAVQVPAPKGTPITAQEYKDEIVPWLKLLGSLVVDPAK
ncbi:hypothetical protein BWI17_21935 [Betaproteobacteria bacterium GR16-43]|nr:hypothetical protein BWI17_21935 [Betaproteobacteria bacterium GR16-43]